MINKIFGHMEDFTIGENGHVTAAPFAQIVYMHDVIRTIERNTDVLSNAFNDIGSPVNVGKSKYMEVGCHQNMTADEYIMVGHSGQPH